MNILQLLSLLLLFFYSKEQDKVLSHSLYNNQYDRPVIRLVFNDNDATGLNALLNTYLPFSLFTNEINAKTISNKTVTIEDTHFLYQKQAKLTIYNYTLEKFSFYYSSESITYFRELGISLAYQPEDESFSLIHHLYKNKIIEHLKFALSINGNKGMIHFGGYPEEAMNLEYKGHCKIRDSFGYWGCPLKGVEVNNTFYKLETDTLIHSGEYAFLYSNELLQFAIENIFNEKITKNVCYVETDKQDGDSIHCKNKTTALTFSLLFNDIKMQFNVDELYSKRSADKFLFRSNPHNYIDYKGVVFGMYFLMQFDLVVFDYENKQLEFFSNKVILDNKVYNNTIQIILCIIVSLLCTISIVYNLIQKYTINIIYFSNSIYF